MSWFRRRAEPKKKSKRSPAWAAVRAEAIRENKKWYGRKTPTCERCLKWRTWDFVLRWPFFVKRKWHGDHIKPYSIYPDLELDLSNIQILCAVCNRAKSNLLKDKGGEFDWKKRRRWWLWLGYPSCAYHRWKQRTVYGWKV